MGPFRGSQAELVRVPFADANCVVLPGESGDEHGDDFVLIADAWVTGWHATELAGVRPADTVAVFGAGAVGLLAAYSARLRGASEVYSVDLVDARLDKAGEMGFVPVDARNGDPVEQIRELTRARRGAGPPGEEEMSGVMAGIDAVGFQARDDDHPDRKDPRQVISDLARLINPTGRVGIAGVSPYGRGTGRARRSCRRIAARPLGHLVRQGRCRRIRAHARPPVHRAPARPDHQRQGPAQPGRHPPRIAGLGP
jgi:glutathione-independent formaldehyde dehydrogenase